MNTNTVSSTIGGIAIALGLTAAGFMVYMGLNSFRTADRYVTIKGLVERVEKADEATTTISFKLAGNDLIQLYQELEANTQKIEDFLVKTGFNKTELTRASPEVTDTHAREYGSEHLPPNRFILGRSVKIQTTNVDLSHQLATLIGELVSQGINMSAFYTNYRLEKFIDLRPEMLAQATDNAKEMAQQFAANSGSKLGGIRTANQGVMSISAVDSAPGEEYNRGERSLMKKVRVVSTFEFYLKN